MFRFISWHPGDQVPTNLTVSPFCSLVYLYLDISEKCPTLKRTMPLPTAMMCEPLLRLVNAYANFVGFCRTRHKQRPGSETRRLDKLCNASATDLFQIRTAGSISISPEQFEKLFLSPQNAVKGQLRSTFANPTPLALLGFLLSLSPLSFALMGIRGAGGNGTASIGAYYFMGGLLMILGAVGEFLLGNTCGPCIPLDQRLSVTDVI